MDGGGNRAGRAPGPFRAGGRRRAVWERRVGYGRSQVSNASVSSTGVTGVWSAFE